MDPMALLKQSFLEECDELLSALERCLQEMDTGATDTETVNAAFRAIHSIKGGAGAFGFTEIVPYAHGFEAALDLLRNGKVRVADAPLGLFLRTADAVGACVGAARSGQPAPQFPDLIEALRQFVSGGGAAAAAPVMPLAAAAAPEPPPVEAACGHHIRITPHDDLFRRLVEPPQILQSLETLGEPVLTCDVSAVPLLAALDPARCNLRFDVMLDSAATREQVEDVLERCFDADELAFISPAAPAVVSPPAVVMRGSADGMTGSVSGAAAATAGDEAMPAGSAGYEAAAVAAPAVSAGDSALAAARQLPLMSPLPDASGVVPTLKNRPAMVRTIRVDLDRVDRLMNLVGEIVITQSMLIDRSRDLPVLHALQLTEGIEALTRQTRELQDQVMAVRAQPVKTVFQRMPRVVRDLATMLGKQVRLATCGEDTEVDKTIIEELADPLTHMIRNALDHGLENPDERISAGKPVEGVVTLSAEQRGGRIVITIADDGRGLPRDKLLAKAISRGVMAADAKPSAAEIDALIFHAGLSTAEAVTDVSGRGVGMDVVKQNVEALGGRVTVESEPGKGCTFALSLPLTLAVADGMVVKVAGQRIIVPISSIMETLQIANCRPGSLPGGSEIVRLRGQVAPLIRLADLLELGGSGQETVVISAETDRGEIIGIAVDEILGQQQVVVKSLEASFGPVAGASAATILGDGMVALILDIDALPALVARRGQRPQPDQPVLVPHAA
ncbi:MAG: chemotaxis protein CheA [Beijerinckiaceae bacterium]|nr:chemotaxis protein CheA [Beijerinckiaceae bacterium]